MRRKVRKHLKQDQLVSTITKVADFIRLRTREILTLIGVVVLVIIGFVISSIIKAQNVKKESRVVAEMLQVRSQLDDDPAKVAELEKRTGNKNYARLANVLLGTYWVEKGKFDKAEEVLSPLKKGKKDLIYYQAQELLAQIQVKKGNYDNAIEIYTRIEKDKPRSYALDGVLFHRAEALMEKGEKEEALALYKKIKAEYPQTSFGYDAAAKVRDIEGEK